MADSQKETTIEARQRAGRERREKGAQFEEKVAEYFRLHHYDVQHGRLFGGRQVDIFLTRKLGDLTIQRALECKAGGVSVDDLDRFVIKLGLVRLEYPAALGTLVSGAAFTDAVAAHAAKIGVQLTTFRDLSSHLFDGMSYVDAITRSHDLGDAYRADLYVEQAIAFDSLSEAQPAFELIEDWLTDPTWSQLTLLGDVGTGKTFLCRMLTKRLAEKYRADPVGQPLPIYVDLRNAAREFSLEGLVTTHLVRGGLRDVSFDMFQYALAEGRCVVIFDGFDEMSARVSPEVTSRNFHELARCVVGKAKVLLTCRTHYFRSRTEEEEVVLGGSDPELSESATDLYWDLITRKGYRIAYVRPFRLQQIEEYVRRALPSNAEAALAKIRKTYNLMELSQRPMLLDMVVKSIDKLGRKAINPASLYHVFTNAWIHRDRWRHVLGPKEKVEFLTALARSLWSEGNSRVHHSHLLEHLESHLSARIADPRELVEIDSEVRTASFLVRDEEGNYGFAHKSYSEFFVARHMAKHLARSDLSCLDTARVTPEIVAFLYHMLEGLTVEERLEATLQAGYVPRLSENALVVLYGLRREKARQQETSGSLSVELAAGIDVAGAQLAGAVLEGAVLKGVNFSGAKLSNAKLSGAVLPGSNLRGADLESAVLSNADLSSSDLTDAVLDSALLDGALFTDACLTRARLSDATLGTADLRGAVLDGVIGFVTMERADELLIELLPEIQRASTRYDSPDPAEVESLATTRLMDALRRGRVDTSDKQRLAAYVNMVVRHAALDARRRWQRRGESIAMIEAPEPPSEGGVEASIEVDELLARAAQVLDTKTLEILRLTAAGYTTREIGEVLDIHAYTVRKRLQRARQRLRDELDGG